MTLDRLLRLGTMAVLAFALAACDEQKAENKADEKPAAVELKSAAPVAAADDKKLEAIPVTEAHAKSESATTTLTPSGTPATVPPPNKAADAPAAPAAAAANEKTSEVAPSSSPTGSPSPVAATSAANGDNAGVQAAAKAAGLEFEDGRYRDKDNHPMPVVTKDYKVDWAVWQGFWRYHDACHVCHGPNAGGSTFAPALAQSLNTMDYETFYGTVAGCRLPVAGGRQADRAGTTYVMPAFGEDKNIMRYLDNLYS